MILYKLLQRRPFRKEIARGLRMIPIMSGWYDLGGGKHEPYVDLCFSNDGDQRFDVRFTPERAKEIGEKLIRESERLEKTMTESASRIPFPTVTKE
jgi:hypothetical protein